MENFDYNEFLKVFGNLSNEEEIKNFVMNRLDYLEKNSQVKTISTNNDGNLIGNNYFGYINSDSPIIASFMADPFYMNDATLYIEFLKFIKGRDISKAIQFFISLQEFVEFAFGVYGVQKIREGVYFQDKPDNISIADFYKNNSAMCVERSATVQNLSAFCGLNSYMVLGKLRTGEDEVAHVYNIFVLKSGNLMLFDVTNPVKLNKNGEVSYGLAINILDSVNIDELDSVNFDLGYVSNIYKTSIHDDEKDRVYLTYNYYKNRDSVKK